MQESQLTQITQQNEEKAAVKQTWRKPTITFVALQIAVQQTTPK